MANWSESSMAATTLQRQLLTKGIEMLPRLFSLVSFDSFLALLALAALQYFPIPGVFLTFFGAAFVTGLLVHIFLASLFVEALMHRVPRVFVAVPILAYAGYYTIYIDEADRIAVMNAELQAVNPGRVLDFDPKLHSIVMDQAREFVETHDVPVVYAPDANFPEAHLSSVDHTGPVLRHRQGHAEPGACVWRPFQRCFSEEHLPIEIP
jgi:hypothetical protein